MTGARVRHGRNGHDGPPAHVTGRSAASGFPVLARDCDGVGDSRAASGESGSPLMAVRPSNARGKSSPSSCPPRPRRRPVASQPSQAQPSPSRSRPLQPPGHALTHPRPHTRNNPGTPTHTHTTRIGPAPTRRNTRPRASPLPWLPRPTDHSVSHNLPHGQGNSRTKRSSRTSPQGGPLPHFFSADPTLNFPTRPNELHGNFLRQFGRDRRRDTK